MVTPNLVLNAVLGSCPSVTLSPAWMKHFVVTVLNGLDRHVPQEKQLPTGFQFTYFGVIGLNHCVPSDFLKSLREIKLMQSEYSMT